MKTFVVSSSCWKILLFLSIHRDQITNSTSVCSPFICWFESIVNWVNQACKSWSADQLVGEREGQVAHADTKVQTYLEYEHSATKWKAVSKTRRFLLHSWKPTRCKLFMSHGFRFRNVCRNQWSKSRGAWERNLPQLLALCTSMESCQVYLGCV